MIQDIFLLRYNNLKQSQYGPRAMQTQTHNCRPRVETICNAAKLFAKKKKKKSVQCPTASPEQGQQPLLFANRVLPFIKWVILWGGGEGLVIPSNRLLPDYAALSTLDKWAL